MSTPETTPTDKQRALLTKARFDGYLPIVIDVETGGVNPETDALLEVAAIVVYCDENNVITPETEHYSCHITPFEGGKMHEKAMQINGIDVDHPFRFAISEEEALKGLDLFARQALARYHCRRALLVGHNAHFDLAFLNAARKRCQLKNNPFHAFTCFDTATLSGAVLGKTVLAKALLAAGLSHDKDEAHSALYDTQQTAALFCELCRRIPQLDQNKGS